MARRSRDRSQRDASVIPTSLDVLQPLSLDPASLLAEIEDRRQWHPEEPFQVARSVARVSDAFTVAVPLPATKSRRGSFFTPDKFRYAVPEKVAVCIRRKERREVLFAKRKTGKGSRRVRRRRNYQTAVSCK